MTDLEARSLDLTFCLREPTLRLAVASLDLPAGSHGLDAGCGIGLLSVMLAEVAGPDGRVTGLDLQPSHLAVARGKVAARGLQSRLSFQPGDVAALPFEDDAFDWAWSSDCVGYGPWDTPAMLKELGRVVRPGGSVNLVFWSSEQLLPGYPELEARLRATSAGIAPFARGMAAERHPLRMLGPLRTAGLMDCRADAFAGSVHAPLTDDLRTALVDLFEMRWAAAEQELSAADRAEFRRLCDPASPDFIVDVPEYYALYTLSLFRGTVPG